MSTKNPISVIVEGTKFDSISAAARYLNVNSTRIWYAAHRNKPLNGLSISFENKVMSQAKSLEEGYQRKKKEQSVRNDKRNCPVICETLNKKFKTIKAAAKFAKVNGWTMGMKMEAKGQFIDKNGNVYKRLKPMNTKNVYTTNSDTLTKEIHRNTKTTTPVINNVVKENGSISALQNDAMNFIKTGNYKQATKFLEALKMITTKED